MDAVVAGVATTAVGKGLGMGKPWESIPASRLSEDESKTRHDRTIDERPPLSAALYRAINELPSATPGGSPSSTSAAMEVDRANVSSNLEEVKNREFRRPGPHGDIGIEWVPNEKPVRTAEEEDKEWWRNIRNRMIEAEHGIAEEKKVLEHIERTWNASEYDLPGAMQDVAAAAEVVMNRDNFLQRVVASGISVTRLQAIRASIMSRFGDSQQARATLRRWIVNRVLPAIGSAAATYALKQAWPVDKDKKGGIAGVEDDDYVDEDEIDRAAKDIAGPDADLFNSNIRAPHNAWNWKLFEENASEADESKYSVRAPHNVVGTRPLRPLPGSAAGTAAPAVPLGPTDSTFPKSSPIYPQSGKIAVEYLPGAGVFDEFLTGDYISERANEPAANVLKSSIPPGPTVKSVPSSQHYANVEPVSHRAVPPPTPSQNLKRKAAAETSHHERTMEGQITQNYDPTFVSGLPSSVTANSSTQWKEYVAPYRGYNIPLDDAPNVVGLYDAQESERERAQAAGTRDKEPTNPAKRAQVQVPQPETPTATPVVNENPSEAPLNAANETNPAFRNVGRARPAPERMPRPASSRNLYETSSLPASVHP